MRKGFKEWLKAQEISKPGNYISRIKRIESHYGDIDLHYEKDGCSVLLAEFEYSNDDRKNKREKRHKIPMEPKAGGDKYKTYYEGTKDLASRIKKYIEYRESEQNEQLGANHGDPIDTITQPSPSEIARRPASVQNRSKRNARYKTAPIGNAQNAIIRTILSNLGNESFTEKDWEETKRHFNGKCVYCGASENIVRDHAIPINRYKLGEHRLGNIVPACSACNSKKGGEEDFIEFCAKKEDAAERIKEYMASKDYIPLTEDKEKSDKMRIIIHKAHEETRFVAEKYIELINDLFFQTDGDIEDEQT